MGPSYHYLWIGILVLLVMTKATVGYNAAYACDGRTLKIECKEGYIINLVRANYGRYSITVCNDNGSTDWSVNCMSNRSSAILHAKCGSKNNCSVPAIATLFDDPCPGTVKYLEAHYTCVSATASSTTSKTTAAWRVTSAPNVWSTAKTFTVPPEVVVPPTTASTFTLSVITTARAALEPEPEDNYWVPTNNIAPVTEENSENDINMPHDTFIESVSTEGSVLENKVPYCKPIVIRNLSWNWTAAGEVPVQPCPGGASGFARWRCQKTPGNTAIRYPDTPDLSECRTVWLSTLEDRITDGDSLTKIAADLSQVTESKILFGGDIDTTAKIIHNLGNKMSKDIQTFPDPRQREAIVYDLLQSIAKVVSNILDVTQQPSWNDLSYKEQMRVATELLVGLEESSFLLADTMVREKVVTHCTKNMLLSVQVLEIRNVDNEIFPTYSVLENCSMRVNDWLQLQRSALLENSEGGLVRLVYMSFDTLEHVLKVQSYGQEQKKINSKILSASLGKGRHIELNKPVTLCLQHLQTENVSNPTCVFWDYTQGNWTNEGCTIINTNETHTICRCNHLTNFAILVDVTPSNMSHTLPIMAIAIIGLLIILLIVFLFLLNLYWRQNHKDYDSAFQDKWFSKCYGCCRSSEAEKTVNCKGTSLPRPSLYGNTPIQVEVEGPVSINRITNSSSTLSRSYINESNVENHYPTTHIRLNHTYNRNGSIRRIKEARRLEHLENTLRNKRLIGSGTLQLNGPKSHTYSEITANSSRNDPVYEEIEKEREHRSQISDVSDTSRHSSKSYGDNRPLIPCNQVPDYGFRAAMDAAYRKQLQEQAARSVSVLDGQTVICHLQEPDHRIYQKSLNHPSHYS